MNQILTYEVDYASRQFDTSYPIILNVLPPKARLSRTEYVGVLKCVSDQLEKDRETRTCSNWWVFLPILSIVFELSIGLFNMNSREDDCPGFCFLFALTVAYWVIQYLNDLDETKERDGKIFGEIQKYMSETNDKYRDLGIQFKFRMTPMVCIELLVSTPSKCNNHIIAADNLEENMLGSFVYMKNERIYPMSEQSPRENVGNLTE
jgi:hypothetical protein